MAGIEEVKRQEEQSLKDIEHRRISRHHSESQKDDGISEESDMSLVL